MTCRKAEPSDLPMHVYDSSPVEKVLLCIMHIVEYYEHIAETEFAEVTEPREKIRLVNDGADAAWADYIGVAACIAQRVLPDSELLQARRRVRSARKPSLGICNYGVICHMA